MSTSEKIFQIFHWCGKNSDGIDSIGMLGKNSACISSISIMNNGQKESVAIANIFGLFFPLTVTQSFRKRHN